MMDKRFPELLSGWGLSIGFLLSLLGACPVGAQGIVASSPADLSREASPALQANDVAEGAPDNAVKQRLIEQIETTQKQLRDARDDLARLQRQQARTQQELEKQQKEERRLRANISRYEDRIRRGKREYDIYDYNLTKRFPREQRRLNAERQAHEAELMQLDSLLAVFIRGGALWPPAGDPLAVRQSFLCRAVLQRTLPRMVQRKQELLDRSRTTQDRLAEIERLTQLDQHWIASAERRLASHDKNHSSETRQLEESARKRREARQEYERLQRRIEALNALVAEIQVKLPLLQEGIDYKSFVEQQGQLFWPVPGEVVHGYGPRKHPEFDLMLDNSGIDLTAVAGEEIRAVAGGWVVYTGTLPGYGSLVMIHHGSGYFSFYTPAVPVEGVVAGLERETRVEQGQVIARLGGSPSVRESLLHVEIRQGETALNPLDWLSRRAGKSAGDASGASKE